MGAVGTSRRCPQAYLLALRVSQIPWSVVSVLLSIFRMSVQLSGDDFTVTGPRSVMVDSPVFKSYSKRLKFCGAVWNLTKS